MARNIVITGGNNGIGKAMAQALAASGERVVIASRNCHKSEAVVREIKAVDGSAQIEAMSLDLANFTKIDEFAAALRQRMPVIDGLMANAGLYTHGARQLDNGFEAMIGVMHFGHFRLTRQLLPALEAAPQGRIVVTSSMLHKLGKIKQASFKNPDAHRMAVAGYAQAKLANLLFTRALARRLAGTSVTVNAFHPGSVKTGIWQELPGLLQRAVDPLLISEKRGADTGVWLARAPEARAHTGEYFIARKIAKSSAASRDPALADWLWDYSQQQME